MVGRASRVGESGLEQWFQAPVFHLGLRQRIGRVMDLTTANAARCLRKKQVAFGEEECERAGFGCFGLGGDAVADSAALGWAAML